LIDALSAVIEKIKLWSRTIRRDVIAVWLAARDPRVPWYAKAVALATVAYAASPIDLIPDFVPVLGHLDDLIIVPCGLWLAIRLIPPELMAEFRAQALQVSAKPRSIAAGIAIVAIWISAAALLIWWLWPAGDMKTAGPGDP
jgi:uncharacterized membrane protein YkvA (DUF1232 family)